MSRTIAPGTVLHAISGSLTRKPACLIDVWNPRRVSISDIVDGSVSEPPIELSAFCTGVTITENIGHENADDPSPTRAEFSFVSAPNSGINLRPGFIDDGVIVRVRAGDRRVSPADWPVVFTGHFRGRPGVDAGTRADRSQGMTAIAYGREAEYLEQIISTESHAGPVDTGVIANDVARNHMGLRQAEIAFGMLGFVSFHQVNQVVEENALTALWHLMFPAGKKPKFNALGQLVAVDVDLEKPAVVVLSAGDFVIRARRAAPNDEEVKNSVLLTGLSHILEKSRQQSQMLTEVMPTTGHFDSEFKERLQYSADGTQRAEDTFLITKKRIKFSDADWEPKDEFSGTIEIDTHYLRNVQAIIFVSWLALQIYVAVIDLFFQEGGVVADIVNLFGASTPATTRFVYQVLSQTTFALLIWSMNFIGRGRYQVHGKTFEYVYQALESRCQLVGLLPHQVREAVYRNDLLSKIEDLDARARALLKRELVKNQVHEFELLDNPGINVDDVFETFAGDRFYVRTVQREYRRGGAAMMRLSAWKVFDGRINRLVKTQEALA